MVIGETLQILKVLNVFLKVQTCVVDVLGGVVVRSVVLSTCPIAMLNKLDLGSHTSS